ncbi:RICIN domain-containing protein [Cryptosporangium arvum]|uniref:RICIN domain-containing protein n=1 Tax=Cryptosporangium arvum TaxID=80871 RepID=UPI00056261C9|nr:RICIN domain-containing protein [Cryptosporangium arvum]
MVLTVLGAALLGVAQSPATAATLGPYQIFPASPDPVKCLDVPDGTTANGASIIIYTCDRLKENQQWYFDEVSTGVWEIRNRETDKCMVVKGASTASGAAIIQYTCNGSTNSRWRTDYVRPAGGGLGWYKIRNAKSNLCIAVKGAGTANKTTLVQYACNGTLNGQFTWNYPFP